MNTEGAFPVFKRHYIRRIRVRLADGSLGTVESRVGESLEDALTKATESFQSDDEHGFNSMGKGAGI